MNPALLLKEEEEKLGGQILFLAGLSCFGGRCGAKKTETPVSDRIARFATSRRLVAESFGLQRSSDQASVLRSRRR